MDNKKYQMFARAEESLLRWILELIFYYILLEMRILMIDISTVQKRE